MDLRNNRLTTPKVGYMATVFDNKNDPTKDALAFHALTGNPWKCNDIDNNELKEYAVSIELLDLSKRKAGLPKPNAKELSNAIPRGLFFDMRSEISQIRCTIQYKKWVF